MPLNNNAKYLHVERMKNYCRIQFRFLSFINKYNKSSVVMVKAFLDAEFSEYYDDFFKEWYEALQEEYSN